MVFFSPFGGSTNPSGGSGASSMFEGMTGAAGAGLSIAGAITGYGAAQSEGNAQSQLGQEEQSSLGLQKQQMTLDFQRQQRQLVRSSLQTQAQSKSASVTSGSQFGSGEKGGQAQIAASGATSGRNLSQNYSLGQQGIDIAQSEVGTATQIGQDNSSIQTGQSMMSAGSSLVGDMKIAGQVGGFLAGFL